MAVAQPTHLLVFNETSGANVTNYGTVTNVYAIQQGSSPTNYEWQQQSLSPTAGRIDLKTPQGGSMPYMTTAASAQSSSLATLNLAFGLEVDAFDSPLGTYVMMRQGTDRDAVIYIDSPAGSGDFDLSVRLNTENEIGANHTFSALTFGTFYQVAASFNVSTPSAGVCKFKLGSGSVQTSSTFNASGTTMITAHPYINRHSDFTGYGGLNGRIYYIAYQRGGTAWGDTDLGDINSNPATAITGWPSGGGSTAHIPAYLQMLRANQ